MKYLIDTCIISYFVRGDSNVVKVFKATDPSLMAISSITAMEIEYGIQLHPERTKKLLLSLMPYLKLYRFYLIR